ncbi:uncharacterized protein VTP21DRAFT_6786 [Calcarisporiella thermophila]|uniref:uncharacterized protein n=1 Tax=Calcarisporiella thermophila TaxID=911321 RepID=UPI0037422D78
MTRSMPLLITDFDRTITQEDTISILAQYAYKSRGEEFSLTPPTTSLVSQHQNDLVPWWKIVKDYVEDLEKNVPPQSDDLDAVLDFTHEVEHRSLSRIEAAKIFRSLTPSSLYNEAMSLPLQPHVLDVLSHPSLTSLTYIISVNWSRDWIQGATRGSVPKDRIISNDLEMQGNTTTGMVIRRCVTGADKRKEMRKIREKEKKPIIYVGDSVTDLGCLVDADVGFVFGDSTSLLTQIRRLKIELLRSPPPPLDALLGANPGFHISPVLYKVTSWKEIGKWLEFDL